MGLDVSWSLLYVWTMGLDVSWSLWGSQSINGPSMSVRSSGNLDGSQWVCGTLCESAVPFENPDGFQLICGALGVYAGPSMSLASSQSVCGSSVILRGPP